ncbi:dihydroneopterin aldolase [Caulobacter sp. AP07]|uniref:dihydroneopterin aldolase n=1 Tax=Caulobacter sp. AP07 TaxID=1144304 RepID=UPI0002720C5F|nr:dihydroneopterin aldolase [Caulobacter sp. AP07]EJL27340.1 dihydroneopterin aldolase [Caulobacter sp. AP07]
MNAIAKVTPERALVAEASAQVVRAEVMVRGLRVEADIGVHDHEIGQRQRLDIDVVLEVSPVLVDQLGETIDYNQIVVHAQSLAGERIGLIETFARRLALACLEHAVVLAAEVAVEKPAALREALAGARVVVARVAPAMGRNV